jgi:hypothetical protein
MKVKNKIPKTLIQRCVMRKFIIGLLFVCTLLPGPLPLVGQEGWKMVKRIEKALTFSTSDWSPKNG